MTVMTGLVNYDVATAAGAHAIMQAIHTYMVGVGLTKANWTGTYDGDVTGTSAQAPTTNGGTSAWQAFNFSDSAQATYPITVWFRLIYGNFVNSGTGLYRYVVQVRVSEGVDGSGNALGRVVNRTPSTYGYSSGVDYAITFNTSAGDFARYDGDSLTFILGNSGVHQTNDGIRWGAVELHLERRYDVVTDLVGAGFSGLIAEHVGTSALLGNNRGQAASAMFTTLDASTSLTSQTHANRPGGATLTDYDNTAAVVTPIYCYDPNQRVATYRKMFTIPQAMVTNGAVITLNFSGSEKKYLAFKSTGTSLTATYAILFEWE